MKLSVSLGGWPKKYKDYIITFIVEFFVVVSIFITFKLSAYYFNNEGFSEYSLVRRAISLIYPILFLGLGIALPRYIALANASNNIIKSNQYFVGGMVLIITFTIIVLLILFLFRSFVAFVIFGNSKYVYYIFPLIVSIFGLILHSLVYSYYRGNLKINIANLLQLISIVIIPILSFLLFNKNLTSVILFNGLMISIVSFTILVVIIKKIGFSYIKKGHIKEILTFGIQRLLGDIIFNILFSAPVFIVVHLIDKITAGYISFGVSILNTVCSAFAPLSIVFLPEATKLFTEKNFTLLREQTTNIIKFTFAISLLAIILFFLFGRTLILIYLGYEFDEIFIVTRIIILATLGLGVFISLRSIIDAYYFMALNTRNIIIAFILFLILTLIFLAFQQDYLYILYSFVVSLTVLGFFTFFNVFKILKINQNE